MPIQSTIPILGASDYRDWLSMFDNISNLEKNRKFQRDVLPCLSDYAEGTSFSATLHDHPWLKELLDPDSRFEAILHELEHHPNPATITLANFVKHLAGTVITVAWQEKMKTFVQEFE